ncbi:hypothetical protein SCUP515_08695 [Seiridium cupressi]
MHFIGIAFTLMLGAGIAVQFPNACLQWHSNGTFLIATCTHDEFGSRLTALDLNSCFLNSHGQLKPLRWGRFAASCNLTEIATGEVNFHADCDSGDLDQPIVQNDYPLTDIINVDGGLLNCVGINACDSREMFTLSTFLVLLGATIRALADTPFYGPDAPCVQWMTSGNFLIANCPGPSITSMTVLDLNHCYAASEGHLVPRDNGNFNTDGHCHFVPIMNGEKVMHVNCPDSGHGTPNISSDVLLSHIENRNSMLFCGGVSGCYINGPGCLGCLDTWIRDGIHCKLEWRRLNGTLEESKKNDVAQVTF